MQALTPGHKYVLANFEKPDSGQTIQFIEKEPLVIGSSELRTVSDGTTNRPTVQAIRKPITAPLT